MKEKGIIEPSGIRTLDTLIKSSPHFSPAFRG